MINDWRRLTSVMPKRRYVDYEENYKKDAYDALKSHFDSWEKFEHFYNSLSTTSIKDEFLRVTCFYRLLVKKGDWHVEGSEQVIGYLTNSFKVIALTAIIESLSGIRSQACYATQRCAFFFRNLPQDRQDTLCRAIEINREPLESIDDVARFLYGLRSEFVHDARLVLELHDSRPVTSKKDRKKNGEEDETVVAYTDLSIGDLMEIFEEGLLEYFRREH